MTILPMPKVKLLLFLYISRCRNLHIYIVIIVIIGVKKGVETESVVEIAPLFQQTETIFENSVVYLLT